MFLNTVWFQFAAQDCELICTAYIDMHHTPQNRKDLRGKIVLIIIHSLSSHAGVHSLASIANYKVQWSGELLIT